MLTLKQAVESGRRWRHPVWDMGWRGPGVSGTYPIDTAISSDFEIEPEPEKPREWTLCANSDGSWERQAAMEKAVEAVMAVGLRCHPHSPFFVVEERDGVWAVTCKTCGELRATIAFEEIAP
jgi:hypothetical protein